MWQYSYLLAQAAISVLLLLLVVMYPLNIKSQGSCLLFLTLENLVVDLDVGTSSPAKDVKY